jgi:hypothetical protein
MVVLVLYYRKVKDLVADDLAERWGRYKASLSGLLTDSLISSIHFGCQTLKQRQREKFFFQPRSPSLDLLIFKALSPCIFLSTHRSEQVAPGSTPSSSLIAPNRSQN